MSTFSDSPEQAKRELEEAVRSGKPAPRPAPSSLSLGRIVEIRELFQHRMPPEHASQAHVRELMKDPKGGKPLEPIDVFWSGKQWVCINGHHRLRAYRAVKWQGHIPVRAFAGSLDEALGFAGEDNRKDKLPMSSTEKTNAAWRLVCLTALSKAAIVEKMGVSDGIVAKMRRVLATLRKQYPDEDPAGMTWLQARSRASGEEDDRAEFDLNEAAQQLANRLLKAHGEHLGKNLEVLAEALAIYDKRLPGALGHYWRDEAGEFDEAGEPLESTEF